MFGEGRHPHIERLFETKLAPFLSQSANHFWRSRLWYFKRGLYYQGGMVSPLAPPCSPCLPPQPLVYSAACFEYLTSCE